MTAPFMIVSLDDHDGVTTVYLYFGVVNHYGIISNYICNDIIDVIIVIINVIVVIISILLLGG